MDRNLIDAANIAALSALLTFRRPECTLGGEDGKEVIVHPPEEREPLHLIMHHLPIAVTFAFFSYESSVVIDPTHHEEAVMGGRMTATLNSNGDICAIQKAGGEGVLQSVIMQCLRIASVKASAMTEKIKKAAESYKTERALRKIKRHTSSVPMDIDKGASIDHTERLKSVLEEGISNQIEDVKSETKSSDKKRTNMGNENAKNFIGGPSNWDPYSKGVDSDFLKVSLASHGISMPTKELKDSNGEETSDEAKTEEAVDVIPISSPTGQPETAELTNGEKTLKDAVKPKSMRPRRKNRSSTGPS